MQFGRRGENAGRAVREDAITGVECVDEHTRHVEGKIHEQRVSAEGARLFSAA